MGPYPRQDRGDWWVEPPPYPDDAHTLSTSAMPCERGIILLLFAMRWCLYSRKTRNYHTVERPQGAQVLLQVLLLLLLEGIKRGRLYCATRQMIGCTPGQRGNFRYSSLDAQCHTRAYTIKHSFLRRSYRRQSPRVGVSLSLVSGIAIL